MSEDFLTQGQAALKAGDKVKARQLLISAIKQNSNNEQAWSWLYNAVEAKEQKIRCLQEVIRINPENEKARQALERFQPPAQPATAVAPLPEPPQPVVAQSLAQETQRMPKRKRNRILSFVIIAALVALFIVVGTVGVGGWYYFYGPCGKVPMNKADNKLMEMYSRWMDALKLASSTSRIAISGPIASLQSIRQETQSVKVPSCMQDAKASFVESMNNSIDGFLAFAADEGDAKVNAYFDQSGNNIDEFVSQILEVRKCAPLCYIKK